MSWFNFILFLCCIFILQVNGLVDHDYDDEDEYIGNPDDKAVIERPCQVYDIYCIRKFFASHAKCTIAKGPPPDPVYRTQTNYYIPKSNFTGILTEIMITGFNKTRIEEFYINKATNNLVIAMSFRDIVLTIPSTYAKFYRRGREPIQNFLTFAGVILRAFTVTVIIPYVEDLQLDKSEMTVFLDEFAPVFYVSPTIFDPPDPQVLAGVPSLFVNFQAVVNEVAVTEAYYYGSIYIQTDICDFGLKVF